MVYIITAELAFGSDCGSCAQGVSRGERAWGGVEGGERRGGEGDWGGVSWGEGG